MRVVLISSTLFGLQCLEEGILQVPDAHVVGIITTPPEIRISYSTEPVKIRTHADFSNVAPRIGADVAVLDGKVDSNSYKQSLERWRPDLLLVLGWYFMISKSVRALAANGCLGIHASLLPKYRGGAPIPWAIINGEKETGVTLFHLEDGVDSGDIVAQQRLPITEDDTCATVYDKATAASIGILRKALPELAQGTASRVPQDESKATIFSQRSPADGLIDWSWDSSRIHNFVRAQTRPYPGAFTYHDSNRVSIWGTRLTNIRAPADAPVASIVRLEGIGRDAIGVCCADGLILAITDAEPMESIRTPGMRFENAVIPT